MWVNVEGVSDQSPLVVELLDRYDRPLPDYSGANAARISRGGTRVPIHWLGGRDRGPQEQACALRVNFPDSDEPRLYAIYFSAGAGGGESRGAGDR